MLTSRSDEDDSASSASSWRSSSGTGRSKSKVQCETDLQQRWRRMKKAETGDLELPKLVPQTGKLDLGDLRREKSEASARKPRRRRQQQQQQCVAVESRECYRGEWTIQRLLSKLLEVAAAPAVDVESGSGGDARSNRNKMAKRVKKKSIRFVKVRPEEEAVMMATAPASPVVNCVGQVSRKKTPLQQYSIASDGFCGTAKSSSSSASSGRAS